VARRTTVATLVTTWRWRVLLASSILVRMRRGAAVLVVLVVIVVGRAAVRAAGCSAVCRASITSLLSVATWWSPCWRSLTVAGSRSSVSRLSTESGLRAVAMLTLTLSLSVLLSMLLSMLWLRGVLLRPIASMTLALALTVLLSRCG